MLKARAPLILDLPEEAWFDIGLMHKDIRLALEAAGESRTPVPSGARRRRGADRGGRARVRASRPRRIFEVLGKL